MPSGFCVPRKGQALSQPAGCFRELLPLGGTVLSGVSLRLRARISQIPGSLLSFRPVAGGLAGRTQEHGGLWEGETGKRKSPWERVTLKCDP